MKRLCVFAHYDKDNIIDEYVIYYLKALKELCETIIFVSDCNIDDTSSLVGITDYNIIGRHEEYDFGSYKKGFLLAQELNLEFDELIFANDSCYGPLFPLKPIFDKMERKNCDWWGLTKNNYGLEKKKKLNTAIWAPNIQSYFLVFKSNVFQSDTFIGFINSIQKETSKSDVINKYEIGLFNLLNQNNFKHAVCFNKYTFTESPLLYKWDKLIKNHKFPFFKTMIAKNGIYIIGEVKNWDKVISSVSNYPLDLISKNASRFKNHQENQYAKFNIFQKIRYNFFNNIPLLLREIFIILEKIIKKIIINPIQYLFK